jgi:periplasmic protein TonB
MHWREGQGARTLRWAAALALVFGMHAAAAYSILRQPEALDDELEGAFVIELAPLTTTVHAMPDPPAQGRESEDSTEVQAVKPQARPVEAQAAEAPLLPKPPEVPEELALPERHAETKETPEPETKEQPQRQQPVEASQAAVAARPLNLDNAAPADKTAAPMAGATQSDVRTKAKWHRELAGHLERFKRYPPASASRGESGDILLKFVLDRAGRVASTVVAKSSGSRELDAAAIDMVMRASPLPPPPDAVPGEKIELQVPVRFKVKN